MAQQVFRCGSVYDPDYSVGGHQAMGFDAWAGVYNHYTVLSSRIVATFVPTSSAYPYMVGIYGPSDDSTVPTDAALMIENKRCKAKLLGTDLSARYTTGMSYNRKAFFGASLDNAATSSSVTTNPAEEAFFTLYCQSMNVVNTTTVVVQYKVVYTVRFYEPKDQAFN